VLAVSASFDFAAHKIGSSSTGSTALKLVRRNSSEWKNVLLIGRFEDTMPRYDWRVLAIARVENEELLARYEVQQFLLGNEEWLWHGSRSCNSEVIAKEGFDINYSNGGMWGKGLYFHTNASYSDSFARSVGTRKGTGTSLTFVSTSASAAAAAKAMALPEMRGAKQLILTRVVLGKPFQSQPNSALVKPPVKHQSVQSINDEISIVYDEDRAYPAYIIEYVREIQEDDDDEY